MKKTCSIFILSILSIFNLLPTAFSSALARNDLSDPPRRAGVAEAKHHHHSFLISQATPTESRPQSSPSPTGPPESPPPSSPGPSPGSGIPLDQTLRDSNITLPDNLPTLNLEDQTDPVSAVESILLNYVINPIFIVSGGVAVIVIMYSSFSLITGRGEEEALAAAKKNLIWAFLGLGLVMVAYTLVRNIATIVLNLF